MYLPIESIGDQEDFQQWSDSWGMRFNMKKCHIMRVSKSTRPLSKFYYLCITSLSEVNCAKYLRVNITNDLQWSNHISGISSQANSSSGLIRINLRSCLQKLKEVAYMIRQPPCNTSTPICVHTQLLRTADCHPVPDPDSYHVDTNG